MGENEEELKKRKDKLYCKMREIRSSQGLTFGDKFKYIRGQGLVRR